MASSQMGILANVLHRMKSLEESHSQHAAVLYKLKVELQDVGSRVKELEVSQKSALKEVRSSLQTFGEQMTIIRRKEQEKARLAFLHLRQEMEEERKTCRLLKLQNQKLAKDLMNADKAAADACEELKREREARELLEEVCNELAREIGEDKAEVEQLKQEQEKSRMRLEEELKMIKMDALWQDERVKENVAEAKTRLYEGNGKQCMPSNELRSKLQAFVEVAGVCTHKGSQEQIDKQAEQARILSPALHLLEVHASREYEDRNDEAGSPAGPVSGAACLSTCSLNQENGSNMTENMGNRDSGNHCLQGEAEILHGVERRVSVNGKRKPGKSRWTMRARRQQRRNGGMTDQKSFHFWESHGTSAWASSEDEPDQRKLVTSEVVHSDDSQHGGRQPELAKSSEGVMMKESISPEQSHRIAISSESHRKAPGPINLEREGYTELCGKLEADLSPSVLYSLCEDNTTSCIMRVDELRGKQESALHAQGGNAVIRQQEQRSFSDVRDEHHGLYHHNNNLDTHRSTGGMGSTDTKLAYTSFQPVLGTSNATADDQRRHEGNGDHDTQLNVARVARSRRNCDDEACSGKIGTCSEACKDFKTVHENVESITIDISQELSKLNVQGSAYSGDNETMKKMSPWRPSSAKSLPWLRFWSPSPDAFSSFGGAMKRSNKTCTLSPPNAQDEERHTTSSSGMHSYVDTIMEGTIAKEPLNQQHFACMKGNSLGAQLVRARELENETKPAKPSFRFSPLRRRTVSYG